MASSDYQFGSSGLRQSQQGTSATISKDSSEEGIPTSLLQKLTEEDVVVIEEEHTEYLVQVDSTVSNNREATSGDGISEVVKSTTAENGRPKLSDGPRSKSKYSSFRMARAREQNNTCHEHRSWFRECLDSINQFRYQCGIFVNHTYVQFFVIALIAVNAIMLGLATFDFVKDDPRVSHAFDTTDSVFLVVFTVELAFQFIFHGVHLFLDGWLVFDFVIITCSWSFASVQVVRSFRIFRALRLVTRIRILKNLISGELCCSLFITVLDRVTFYAHNSISSYYHLQPCLVSYPVWRLLD